MARPTAKGIHVGHRERMRLRVQENGLDSLQEHEALEYLLFQAIPRCDTNVTAHLLIERFHGFCGVLEASEEELRTVDGVGAAAAHYLHTLLEAARYYALHKRDIRRPLKEFAAAVEYVRPYFLGKQEELFYMIALDDAYKPLHSILIAKGLPDKVRFDTQALARTAVALHCSRVLLAHNHPSGLAAPSPADQNATGYLAGLLGPLGITIADHIIITPDDATSLRTIGRLPYYDTALQSVVYPSGL